MELKIIGPSLYSKKGTVFDPQVATIFPKECVEESDTYALVTAGTTHLSNRESFCRWLEEQRCEPLSDDEHSRIWQTGVDLIVLADLVLIRPDPQQIDLVMRADEILQSKVNKLRIRFELASNTKVRDALTQRGELWRIAAAAVTNDEMKTAVRAAKMKLGGRTIYYYSPPTGTRLLTFHEFKNLAYLDTAELYQHLVEIQTYCDSRRTRGGLEVDFFPKCGEVRTAFREAKFAEGDDAALWAEHQRLCGILEKHVHPRLRLDDFAVQEWLIALYTALYPLRDYATDADEWLSLAPEFRKHVKWLPGGRLKRGYLDFDTIFDGDEEKLPAEFQCQENRRAKAIILNFVRDYGDLEHINVGWINESLSRAGRPERGRRDVYVVVMKRASESKEQIRIVRMQKWDMSYRLDTQKNPTAPDAAMFETEEYTEYTQDRYLGCRRLGMNLFGPVRIGKISELYKGRHTRLYDMPIWTPYFERAYLHGVASDTIPKDRWERPGYAEQFAKLLGQAAAPNIIVGCGDGDWQLIPDEKLIVFFDDGDEVVVERDGIPVELVVMHHTGSFWHYNQPLYRFAEAYAYPVNRRMDDLPDPARFAQVYLESMIERFVRLQQEYREEEHSFHHLFHLRHVRDEGNFANRWQCVLRRLRETNPQKLKDAIAARFKLC